MWVRLGSGYSTLKSVSNPFQYYRCKAAIFLISKRTILPHGTEGGLRLARPNVGKSVWRSLRVYEGTKTSEQ